MKKFNPDIFKAYDIRGKFPEDVNEEIAERIGKATAIFLSRKLRKKRLKILVCQDVRLSSERLKNAVVSGIIVQGNDVFDAGIGTTPFFYFLMSTKNFDGGIMVTASHNPPEYNGFKIRGKRCVPISMGTGLEKIKNLVNRKFENVKEPGSKIMLDLAKLRKEYIDFLSRGVSIGKMSAVIDASGGSACFFLPELLNKFPQLIYKPLFFEPDGSFRKHSPNPLLKDAQKFIKKELERSKFKFGAIFDGDGDRIIFFDEKGNHIPSEFIIGLFADEELKKNPRSWFVLPINTSRGVHEYIAEKGGRIKLSRVGATFVHEAMVKAKASSGGELSGHFYFKDFYYNDSGIFAWLKLADILSQTHKPLSHLIEPLNRYINSGEINFNVKDKKAVLKRVLSKYKKTARISLLDGITADFEDWRFNIRPSNTEPLIRFVLEAKTKELFEEKIKELRVLIK